MFMRPIIRIEYLDDTVSRRVVGSVRVTVQYGGDELQRIGNIVRYTPHGRGTDLHLVWPVDWPYAVRQFFTARHAEHIITVWLAYRALYQFARGNSRSWVARARD